MTTTTRRRCVRLTAVGALSAVAFMATAGALPAAGAIAEPVRPGPRTYTASPGSFGDNLRCDGSGASGGAQIVRPIAIAQGAHIYALAGDTVGLTSTAQACMFTNPPTNELWMGFTPDEITWTLVDRGGASTDLGPGQILQSGRDLPPTIATVTRTLTTADDGTQIQFGTNQIVTAPNGIDTISATTADILHVLDPHVAVVMEVCTAADLSACDPADPAGWAKTAEITQGQDVVWRITATNTGNVALQGVRVAAGELTGGSSARNECAVVALGDLVVGAAASTACTSIATTIADGTAQNAVKLSSTFDDPTGGELAGRFPAGVESNLDAATITSAMMIAPLTRQALLAETGSAQEATLGAGSFAGIVLLAGITCVVIARRRVLAIRNDQ